MSHTQDLPFVECDEHGTIRLKPGDELFGPGPKWLRFSDDQAFINPWQVLYPRMSCVLRRDGLIIWRRCGNCGNDTSGDDWLCPKCRAGWDAPAVSWEGKSND